MPFSFNRRGTQTSTNRTPANGAVSPPPSVVEPLPVPTAPPAAIQGGYARAARLPAPLAPQRLPQAPQRLRQAPPQPSNQAQQVLYQERRQRFQPSAEAPPPEAPQPAGRQLSPVERFRSINKNLPDGVQYEPLDPETLRLLKESALGNAAVNANLPQMTAPAPPQPNAPAPVINAPAPNTPPAAINTPGGSGKDELIERLMQDERNAGVFYSHLAEVAPRPDIASVMADLAEGCSVRLRHYQEARVRLRKPPFTPAETEINTGIDFENGVALAISEENKAVHALTEWMDGNPDGDTARMLQNMINKKMNNHNLLNFINANGNFPFKFS